MSADLTRIIDLDCKIIFDFGYGSGHARGVSLNPLEGEFYSEHDGCETCERIRTIATVHKHHISDIWCYPDSEIDGVVLYHTGYEGREGVAVENLADYRFCQVFDHGESLEEYRREIKLDVQGITVEQAVTTN